MKLTVGQRKNPSILQNNSQGQGSGRKAQYRCQSTISIHELVGLDYVWQCLRASAAVWDIGL